MKPAEVRTSVLNKMGMLDGGLYLLARTCSRLSGDRLKLFKYYVVAQPVGNSSAHPLRADKNTVIDWVPEGHALCAAFPRRAAVIARRYRSGARCLAAVVKGEFAGFIWLQNGCYEEDEVRCTYRLTDPATCVWDFDVYVAPQFRWGRTLARLWQAADDRLAAEGIRWTLSRISAFNPESLAAHRRLGTVDIDHLLFLRAGRRQFAWRGTEAGTGYRRLRETGQGCAVVELAVPPGAGDTR